MIYRKPTEVFYPELEGADSGLVGTLGVRIIDNSSGTDAVARTTSGVTEVPSGSGHYVATLTAPTARGEYTILWDYGTVTPETTFTEELEVVYTLPTVPVSEPEYPSVADLVAASTVVALTSLTEEQQGSLRAASIAAIEEFCGQAFTAAHAIMRLDGTGTGTLYLPRRLYELTALTVEDSGLEVGDVYLSDRYDKIVVNPDAGATQNYYTQAIRDLSDEPFLGKFSTGEGTVTIEGDWGWASVPEPVVIAIRKDMEDTALADAYALNESVRAFRKLGLREISQGNLRASVEDGQPLSDEVLRLLLPYVWQGPVGVVV